ncbi:hypothetical protein [Alkalihalobacterium alkalinitrilicum]|uniref:hypothetical protein n=1 Tax=Alkalihalobacterium alkalinitrilicum TaxID=427920 RepID=UPI0009958086|nr:hypothetical protein [Alkalihalobacterium alkalinitrilicum]
MSNYIVKKAFRDKFTKDRHAEGTEYKAGKERAAELQKKGFLGEEVNPQVPNEDDYLKNILSKSADKIRSSIDGLSKEQLQRLAELEKEDKNRKTVMELLEVLTSEQDEHKEG